MDIKMLLDPDDPMRVALDKAGFRDDQDSDYIIRKRSEYSSYLAGKRLEQQFFVSVKDIVFIESIGHDVIIHTRDEEYCCAERLKFLETVLDPDVFLRVSNSSIVNLKHIKRIESALLQKFVLHMTGNVKVDVTRSYYYIFRDRIGI